MRWVLWIGAAIAIRRNPGHRRRLQPAESAHRDADGDAVPLPPDAVYALLIDVDQYPVVAPGGEDRCTRQPDRDGRPAWTEEVSGMKIPLYFERMERPSLLVARIADPSLPFGGTWTYRIAPAGRRIRRHDHRRRRGLQPVLPVHVALRLRSRRDARRVRQATSKRARNEPAETRGVRQHPEPHRETRREGRSRTCSSSASRPTARSWTNSAIAARRVRTGGNRQMDMIFALFRHRNDLRRLRSLVPRLKAGRRAVDAAAQGLEGPDRGRDDAQTGLDAGLVDVKVVSFSDVLTAEKFVVPRRPSRQPLRAAELGASGPARSM